MLLLYGGGWSRGDRARMHDQGMALAGAGCTWVASEYRLTGESAWPAQINDVKAAIRWMRSNSERLGIDSGKIALDGNSAGAHLALLAAGTPNLDGFEGDGGNEGVNTEIAAAVAYYPPTSFFTSDERPSGGTPATALMLDAATDALAEAASPISYVSADFPPIFMLHGTTDTTVPVTASLRMYEALIEAGADAEMHIYGGLPHGFTRLPSVLPTASTEIVLFLDRHLVDPDRYSKEAADAQAQIAAQRAAEPAAQPAPAGDWPRRGAAMSGLQFGVFDHIENLDLPLDQIYRDRLVQIEWLDTAGFYAYHLAEHHTPVVHSMAPSQNVFLSAVAQRTERLRFGPCVYVLPLHHPLRLIEEISMLDSLAEGRLEIGVGCGGVLEAFFWGQDSEPEANQARYDETLAIVLESLSHDELTYEGRFHSFEQVPMRLRPMQQPHPPLWYMRNPETAARRGMNCVVVGSLDNLEANVQRYRRIWAETHGEGALTLQGTEPKIGLVNRIILAETEQEAIDAAKPPWEAYRWNLSTPR